MTMKSMTCLQLGGGCERAFDGHTLDQLLTAQDLHLAALLATPDGTHVPVRPVSRTSWRHPVAGADWYMQAKTDFAGLADPLL